MHRRGGGACLIAITGALAVLQVPWLYHGRLGCITGASAVSRVPWLYHGCLDCITGN